MDLFFFICCSECLIVRHAAHACCSITTFLLRHCLQSFEGLVNRIGTPPAALPAPTTPLPTIDLALPGIKGAETGVPTWQEMGFTEAPTSIFKVRGYPLLLRVDGSGIHRTWGLDTCACRGMIAASNKNRWQNRSLTLLRLITQPFLLIIWRSFLTVPLSCSCNRVERALLHMCELQGGEKEALKRLEHHMKDAKYVVSACTEAVYPKTSLCLPATPV